MTNATKMMQELQEENARLRERNCELEQTIAHLEQRIEQLRRFETLIEKSIDGVTLTDLEGHLLYANAAILQMGRYRDLAELQEKDILTFFAPEERERIQHEITPALLEQGSWQGRLWTLRADGTRYLMHNSSFVLADDHGQPLALAGFARDISDQYEKEQEHERLYDSVKQHATRLRTFYALSENAPDGIIVSTLNGTITYANTAIHSMTSYEHDLVGRQITDLLLEAPQQGKARLMKVMAQGSWQGVLTYRRSNGTTFKGQLSAMLIRDEQGCPQAVAGIVRDISQTLELEQALRQSQTLLQSVIDNAPAVIYVKNTAGHYIVVNQQHASLLHRTPEEVLGKTDYDLFPSRFAQGWYASDQQLLVSGTPLEVEEIVPLPDGLHTFLTIKFPVYNDYGEISAIAGIVTDITERKEVEETLRRANVEIEHQVQERTASLMQANRALQSEVAERQRAEMALRNSEEKFRQFFEQSWDALSLVDAQGKVIAWNQGAETMLGLKRSEVMGRFIWDVLFQLAPPERQQPDIYAAGKDYTQCLLENEAAPPPEHWVGRVIRHPDGTRNSVQTQVFPIRTDNEFLLGSITRDISEQHQAQAALSLQRDSAIAMSGASDLAEALDCLLDRLLQIEGLDCGGVYLIDQHTGDLYLVSQRGLSAGFAAQVGQYPRTSPEARLACQGQPLYGHPEDIDPLVAAHYIEEGLQTMAVFPVQSEEHLVAVLTLASRIYNEIPPCVRASLDALAAQLGTVIARFKPSYESQQLV